MNDSMRMYLAAGGELSRTIRSLRYIVTCTRIRALVQLLKPPAWKAGSRGFAPAMAFKFKKTKCFFSAHT